MQSTGGETEIGQGFCDEADTSDPDRQPFHLIPGDRRDHGYARSDVAARRPSSGSCFGYRRADRAADQDGGAQNSARSAEAPPAQSCHVAQSHRWCPNCGSHRWSRNPSPTEDTDWPGSWLCTKVLTRQEAGHSSGHDQSHGVAAAMVHGPSTGLETLAEVEDALQGSHRLDAVRAHLYEMAGDAVRSS